jgi:D-alanyl-lipoteichoic acid acyltransferase DltB (MBOAT superfamily)
MLFNSLGYLFFLVLFVVMVWTAPSSMRKWIILMASLVFYGSWRVEFLFLIIFSASVDYFFSIRIYDSSDQAKRRLLLMCSLSTNIGLLLYFKYTYFLVENINFAFDVLGASPTEFSVGKIILPLGISFYTFLSISYTIDVYRRLFVPIRDFPLYLTYVLFWPHMIAGPILRACELIPQISYNIFRPNADNLVKGVKKILSGLFLKVVLADELAPLVDDAFNADASMLSGLDVWTMAYAFGFQIYFDFAGYSLIAIGSAQLVNVHFPENFNWPYLADSPREFWKRWHITLSSWIRDYLYLPLTGSRYKDQSTGGIDIERGKSSGPLVVLALFVTWVLMGLWHGANWTFAFWGVWHATAIFLYRMISKADLLRDTPRLRSVVGWGLTIPVMMLGWIPFRAGSLDKSFELLWKVIDISHYAKLSFRENFYLFVFLIFVGMLMLHMMRSVRGRVIQNPSLGWMVNGLAYATMFFLTFLYFKVSNQFIYFQF